MNKMVTSKGTQIKQERGEKKNKGKSDKQDTKHGLKKKEQRKYNS